MSRKTGSINHTHQYFRRDDGLWACSGIEGCTHYMPKNMSPAPVGRTSICWQCEKPFQLIPLNMKESKPICDNCEEKNDILDQKLANMPTPTARERAEYYKRISEKKHALTEPDEIEVDEIDEE